MTSKTSTEHRHRHKTTAAFPEFNHTPQTSPLVNHLLIKPSLSPSTSRNCSNSSNSSSRHKRMSTSSIASRAPPLNTNTSNSSTSSSTSGSNFNRKKRVSLSTPTHVKQLSGVRFQSRKRSNTEIGSQSVGVDIGIKDNDYSLPIKQIAVKTAGQGPGKRGSTSFEQNGVYLSGITPISVYPINDMSDVKEIEETFDNFSQLLKRRKQACVATAKSILLRKKEEREGKKGLNNNTSKRRASMPANDIHEDRRNSRRGGKIGLNAVFIDTAYICDVINSIGVDYSRNLHNLRKLENELINKMKQISNLEDKIDGYKKELENLKIVEAPRIAAESKEIQKELQSVIMKSKGELNATKKKLHKIKSSDVNDIRALPKPHKLLVSTIQACALLVGKVETGHSMQDVANNIIMFSPGAATSTVNDDDKESVTSTFAEKVLSVNNVKVSTNWKELRKILKPSLIEDLLKIEPKDIDIDTKEFIKEYFFLTDENGNIILDDPSMTSTQGARNSMHVRGQSQTSDTNYAFVTTDLTAFASNATNTSTTTHPGVPHMTSAPNTKQQQQQQQQQQQLQSSDGKLHAPTMMKNNCSSSSTGSLSAPITLNQIFSRGSVTVINCDFPDSPDGTTNTNKNKNKDDGDNNSGAVTPLSTTSDNNNNNTTVVSIANIGSINTIDNAVGGNNKTHSRKHSRFDSNLSESGCNYMYNMDHKLTLSSVNKVNSKVAGVLLEFLVSIIRCSDVIPKGKELKMRLEKSCTDLELNTKRISNMEDLIFEFERSKTVYRRQADRYVSNILSLQHTIDNEIQNMIALKNNVKDEDLDDHAQSIINKSNNNNNNGSKRSTYPTVSVVKTDGVTARDVDKRLGTAKERISAIKKRINDLKEKDKNRGPRSGRYERKERPQSARSSRNTNRGPRSTSLERPQTTRNKNNNNNNNNNKTSSKSSRGPNSKKQNDKKQGFHTSSLVLVGDGSNIMCEQGGNGAKLGSLTEAPEFEQSDVEELDEGFHKNDVKDNINGNTGNTGKTGKTGTTGSAKKEQLKLAKDELKFTRSNSGDVEV